MAAHKGLIVDLAGQHIKRFPEDLYSFEDIMQIATLALWQATNKYKGDLGAKFQTFAYTCINNALVTEYNKISCQKRGEGKPDLQLDKTIETTYAVETTDHRLADFINTLPPQDRNILIMRLHGYTAKEISEELGKNYRFVQKRILSYKKQLKEYMEGNK